MPSSRPTLPARPPVLVARIVIAVVALCLVAGILLVPLRGAPKPAASPLALADPVPMAARTAPAPEPAPTPPPAANPSPASAAPAESAEADQAAPLAARRVNCAVAKCVALTFDDGPGRHTARLLDSLRASDTKVTFFVLGQSVTTRPAVVRRAAREGHVVASHGWDHKQFTRLGSKAQRSQLARTASALTRAGVSKPTLFRPPYGSYNRTTRTLGAPLILWSVDPRDWKDRSASTVTRRVLGQVRPGSVVLLHDIHGTTVDAVPGIVRQLKARGYTLLTVPELFGTLQPGKVYSSR